MGLGGLTSVSLAVARQKAKEARQLRDADKDPIAERDRLWRLSSGLLMRAAQLSRNAPKSSSRPTTAAGAAHGIEPSGRTGADHLRLPHPRRRARRGHRHGCRVVGA